MFDAGAGILLVSIANCPTSSNFRMVEATSAVDRGRTAIQLISKWAIGFMKCKNKRTTLVDLLLCAEQAAPSTRVAILSRLRRIHNPVSVSKELKMVVTALVRALTKTDEVEGDRVDRITLNATHSSLAASDAVTGSATLATAMVPWCSPGPDLAKISSDVSGTARAEGGKRPDFPRAEVHAAQTAVAIQENDENGEDVEGASVALAKTRSAMSGVALSTAATVENMPLPASTKGPGIALRNEHRAKVLSNKQARRLAVRRSDGVMREEKTDNDKKGTGTQAGHGERFAGEMSATSVPSDKKGSVTPASGDERKVEEMSCSIATQFEQALKARAAVEVLLAEETRLRHEDAEKHKAELEKVIDVVERVACAFRAKHGRPPARAGRARWCIRVGDLG